MLICLSTATKTLTANLVDAGVALGRADAGVASFLRTHKPDLADLELVEALKKAMYDAAIAHLREREEAAKK